jgi:hypothetical protein
MKTQYKYIHFVEIVQDPNHSTWSCRTNSGQLELGRTEWYYPWKQYCYSPTYQAVYSADCLDDISHFMGQLKKTKP